MRSSLLRGLFASFMSLTLATAAFANPQFNIDGDSCLREAEAEVSGDVDYAALLGTGEWSNGASVIGASASQYSNLDPDFLEFSCMTGGDGGFAALTNISAEFTLGETAVLTGSYSFYVDGDNADGLKFANYWVRVIDTSTETDVHGGGGSADVDQGPFIDGAYYAVTLPPGTYRLEVLCNVLGVGEFGYATCTVGGQFWLAAP